MPAEEDYARFRAFAEEISEDDDERAEFVDAAMERKGYKKSHIWTDPEPEPDPNASNKPKSLLRPPAKNISKKPAGQYGE